MRGGGGGGGGGFGGPLSQCISDCAFGVWYVGCCCEFE